jgi:hypothetical protein
MRQFNQHTSPSSPSSSPSLERASVEEKKETKTSVAIIFLSPEQVTTGHAEKLQRHHLRPSQRQVSFHAFLSLCILIT